MFKRKENHDQDVTMNPQAHPRSIQLKQHAAYGPSADKLETLDNELKDHRARCNQLTVQASRCASDVRRYIQLQAKPLPLRTANEDALARSILDGGDVLALVTAARRAPEAMSVRARENVPHFADSDDLDVVEAIDVERAAIELLERAIRMHTTESRGAKRRAISQICNDLQPKREQLARVIADLLLQLVAAGAEDAGLAAQLIDQDSDFLEALRPTPFPVRVLSHPELAAWIAEAVESGLIDRADPRIGSLELEVAASTVA